MIYFATLVIGLVTFFGGGMIVNKGDINKTIKDFSFVENQNPSSTPAPSSFPCLIDGVVEQKLNIDDCIKARQAIVPTIDSDPYVNCGVSSECGGGTKSLRQSVCGQTTCCQIGTNWIFYTSKSQCLTDQNNFINNNPQYNPHPGQNNPSQQNSNNSNNYVYPTYAPRPTSVPFATIPPYPTFVPIPTKSNQELLNDCLKRAQTICPPGDSGPNFKIPNGMGMPTCQYAISAYQDSCHQTYGL
jgi:hypothetical protein